MFRSFALMVLLAANAAVHAALPSSWSIVEIDGLPGQAEAVSDNGTVVGCSAVGQTTRAFIWSNGASRELSPELPSGSNSCAYAVNNAGMAAGWVDGQAAVWQDGTLSRLPVAGVAKAINESGVVAGYINLGSEITAPTHAFMWRQGVLTDLHPQGAQRSLAVAINESGQIAGMVDSRAVIWENGVMRDLGFTGSAGAINDRGELVGLHSFVDTGRAQPYIYNGALTPIPGGAVSELSVLAVTNAGRVLVNGVDSYATILENGERLSFEFMASIRAAGWKRLEPRAMNERGWVVGYALHDGQGRKFLITPQDAPAVSANPLLRPTGRDLALNRMRRP